MIQVKIPKDTVHGAGSKLFAVVSVDMEDSEDTLTELWLAEDEDDLFEQVKRETVDPDGEDENYEENSEIAYSFDEEWGNSMLFTEIGTVKL